MFRHVISHGLELRLLQQENAEALFALVDANRSYLRKWLPWLDRNQTVVDTCSFIASSVRQLTESRAFVAGIWSEGQLAGVISHNRIDW